MTSDENRTRVGDRLTIYPRGKKGTYVADFWQDNVHRKVSLKTPNKKVATERATKIAADLHQGLFRPAPAAVEVGQAAADYVLALRTNERAAKTTVKYAGVFRVFVAFLAARRVTKLHQVTAGMFDAWRAERRAVRHPKTVYSESVIVKQLFKWAKGRKLLPDDPVAGVGLNKPPSEPKAGPSVDQVNAILAAADEPLKTWILVLALTGMRVGELRQLRPADVDVSGNWVHIHSRPGARTKTRRSRKVPLHPRLRAALEPLPQSGDAWFFTARPSRKYPGGGNWINPKRVNDQFVRLLGTLGLPTGRAAGFVVHSLRHYVETFTVNAGVPQRVIDAWLGHQSDQSMAAVYYKLLDADSQAFMARVPFGPAPSATGETVSGAVSTPPTR